MRAGSKVAAIIMAFTGLAASAVSAEAAGGPSCGGDVTTSGTITGLVDPFMNSGTTITGILTINRLAASAGGGKTQDYGFYLVPRTSALPAGSTITYNGVNILNTSSGPQPSLPAPTNSNLSLSGGTINAYSGSSPSGYLIVGFSGASQPDTETVTLNFSLGALGGLPAGTTTVDFDVYFVCKATGGYTNVTTPTLGISNASLQVNTMSALQADAQGTALDFGEIGQMPANTPATEVGSGIYVRSSGPYSIDLSSLNNFLLTYPGGSTAAPGSGNVKYNVTLAGKTAGYSGSINTGFATVVCTAAGLSGTHLSLQAHTDEGGAGKIPSPNYSDTLTVTFAPLAVSAGPAQSCS